MNIIPIPSYPRMLSWDPWADTPSRVFGQLFGSDLDNLAQGDAGIMSRADRGLSEMKIDPNKFQVNLDCHHFKPEDLRVKLLDNKLIISGKHEEKQDQHGFIKREFTRTYLLPQGCVLDQLKSAFNNQGMLSIECPRETGEKKDSAKLIPIERVTSNAAVKSK